MKKLTQLYANVFALILQLRASEDYGDLEELRKRINIMFENLHKEGESIGCRSEELDNAEYALTAFIDATIAQSNWEHKNAWLARTRQYERFGTVNAGEDFFKKLDELRADARSNIAVLEIFYFCLTLGFEGKYKFLGAERLRAVIDDVAQDLNLKNGRRANVLSGSWKRTDEVLRVIQRLNIPLWAVVLSCIIVGSIVFVAASFKIDKSASSLKTSLEQFIKEEKKAGE